MTIIGQKCSSAHKMKNPTYGEVFMYLDGFLFLLVTAPAEAAGRFFS